MWAFLIFCLMAFRLICFLPSSIVRPSLSHCCWLINFCIFKKLHNVTYICFIPKHFHKLWNESDCEKKSVLHKIVLILRNEMRYSRQKYSALDLWLRNFRHKKSPKNARKCSFFDWNTMSWILGQKQSRQMLAKPSSFFAPNTHIFKRLLQKRVNPKSIK